MLTLAGKKVALQTARISLPEAAGRRPASGGAPVLWIGRESGIVHISEPDRARPATALLASFTRSGEAPFRLIRDGDRGWRIKRDGTGEDFAAVRHPANGSARAQVRIGPLTASLMEYGTARATLSLECCYQRSGRGCGFCGHRGWWKETASRPPAHPGRKIDRLVLNTATVDAGRKGVPELVEAAASVPPGPALLAGFEAVRDTALLDALKESGYGGMFCNIESFDESVRRSVMPAKGRVPLRLYERNWDKGLELFGPGSVTTMIIAGLGETRRSVLEGGRRAISRGVNLSVVPFFPMPGTPMEAARRPSFDYMAGLYESIADAYHRLRRVPFDNGAVCERGDAFTAIKDVWEMGVFR